jgi:hypothetical protein
VLWFTQSSTEAKRLGMISINKALAESNKQITAPQAPAEEKPSEVSLSKWLVAFIAIIGIAILGGWLARRSRKGGH